MYRRENTRLVQQRKSKPARRPRTNRDTSQECLQTKCNIMAAATTTNQDAFVIPDELFTFDTDFTRWAAVMRENLKWHDLWDVIAKRDRDSPDPRKEKEALDALKMSCGAEILPHLMYADFSGDVWDILEWFGSRAAPEIKEKCTQLVETAATARAIADDIPEVDKILTRRNYGKWKIYMKNVLLSKYLWALVDDDDTFEEIFYGPRPPNELFFKRRNQTALFIIKMSCGKEMSLHMEGEEDAANAWRRLKYELEDDEAAPAERIKDSVAAASNSDSNGIMFDHQLLTVKNKAYYDDGVNNYESWVFCMKNYLIIQGLWGFEEEDHIIDFVKDEKALDVIKASCAPGTLDYILYMDCAKNAWKELARVGGIDENDLFGG